MKSIIMFLERTYNAPQFAYSVLYNKIPPRIRGRDISHKTKLIKNIPIDEDIPKKAMLELFRIKEIESRASCQGQDEIHPTFFMFRLNIDHNKQKVKEIVNKLNSYKDIKAGYNIGMENKYRIVVTSNLWYNKNPELFNKWWKELPKKIKTTLRSL